MFNYKNKFIERIEDVVEKLPKSSYITVIDLSDNEISDADISLLPGYIRNINLENNSLDNITWDDRDWGTIKLNNNCIDFEEINNIKCTKLDISDNKMEGDLTFINCEIDELNVSENKIKVINFVECKIKKLNISSNSIYEITHLPEDIIELNASNNRISDLCVLPDRMIILDIANNKLESIKNIPSNINKIDLSNNKLISFDFDNVPSNLDYLDITSNPIPGIKDIVSKVKIEQIFYDTENKVPNSQIDSDDDISLVVKTKSETKSELNSKTSTVSGSTNSNSNSNSDSDSDSESSTDSTAVRVSKINRAFKIDADSDDDFKIPSIEDEFMKLNSNLANKLINDSDSEDNIGEVIAKYRFGIESSKSIEHKNEDDEKERRRELQLNAALLREKLIKSEESSGNLTREENQEHTIEVKQEKQEINTMNLSEEQREIIEIIRSRAQKVQKTYSNKININIPWAFNM